MGQYDSRMIGPLDTTTQGPYDPTKDPSLMYLLDDVMVLRYLRDDLGYKSDLRYQGPFGGGYPPPTTFRGDWMSTRWNRPATATAASGSAPAAAPPGGGGQGGRGAAGRDTTPQQPLRNAMRANPSLRVLVGCGIDDLVCSYYAQRLGREQSAISAIKAKGRGAQLPGWTRDVHRPTRPRAAQA